MSTLHSWGQGNVCEVYEYSVQERGGSKDMVVWRSDNVHCPMNTDFRNDADSICYICTGMYTVYLNRSTLVIKNSQPVSVDFFIDIKSFRSHYDPAVDSASDKNEFRVVTKSGNLNFLEPSGSLQACNGTALH